MLVKWVPDIYFKTCFIAWEKSVPVYGTEISRVMVAFFLKVLKLVVRALWRSEEHMAVPWPETLHEP